MEMGFANKSNGQLFDFAMQLNKNSFALTHVDALRVNPPQLQPNQPIAQATLLLGTTGPVQRMTPLNNLQVAVKTNTGVLFFDCLVPHHVLFTADGEMERDDFLQNWRSISDAHERLTQIESIAVPEDRIEDVLRANNIFTIAKRSVDGRSLWYTSLKYTNGIYVMIEVTVLMGARNGTVAVRTKTADVVDGVTQAFRVILASQ
ncbi:hypothetical protein SARC_11105 [Sphaeroforma arctica JP610]|uniref:Beta-adaptin appendage C-terminal subdomain domain-containing protein n=1 Tax=Sphaeroforma arctica JP610 TaxID=667725 RepID=A0A0L0FIU0_9EUKA|nr:hypothetical protein SARC_11105 [Sphaeroforma arctica JP610]KNC76391.1 hypothetical protein SARC_11105 [Sphaeroforma arctica JP610]|eukprot:XP_014150293.1 hypothetical protein SARC_11105 [Sphaeroforma arctica JP610]